MEGTILFEPIHRLHAVISFAIRPKSKAHEENASAALQKLVDEDLALEMPRDPHSGEIILGGTGKLHPEVTVEKLKPNSAATSKLTAPRVPYQEAIKDVPRRKGNSRSNLEAAASMAIAST